MLSTAKDRKIIDCVDLQWWEKYGKVPVVVPSDVDDQYISYSFVWTFMIISFSTVVETPLQ